MSVSVDVVNGRQGRADALILPGHVGEDRSHDERGGQHESAARAHLRPAQRQRRDGESDRGCCHVARPWHHPIEAEPEMPPAERGAERRERENEQGGARQCHRCSRRKLIMCMQDPDDNDAPQVGALGRFFNVSAPPDAHGGHPADAIRTIRPAVTSRSRRCLPRASGAT
jgi:hypothetical protein